MVERAESYDLVIVGMGTAGLLAAHEVLNQRPGTRVLLLDAGPQLAEREAPALGKAAGFGGAGLYLGARLYLGPIGIPVPLSVSAPPGVRPLLTGEAYLARVAQVDALFAELGGLQAELRPAPPDALAANIARAAEQGIEYITSYPSRVLSVEQRLRVLDGLRRSLLARGVSLTYWLRADSVAHADDGFDVTARWVETEDEPVRIHARALVLATGRYGTDWLISTASALGAVTVELPVAYGVRVEVDATIYAPLTDANPDPRLQMPLPDDALIKTYATCPGGRVTSVRRYGACVASGIPLPVANRTANTTTAILLQPGAMGEAGRWQGGRAVAATLNARTPDTLIVQRLAEMRAGRPTTAAALAANASQPTYGEAAPGALHDAYPPAYWDAFETFLARLEALAPGVSSDTMLLYGPAEEHFWYIPTGDDLQTNVSGLFVAGDAAGQSQGIVQAGVAGLLAGGGAAARLDSAGG